MFTTLLLSCLLCLHPVTCREDWRYWKRLAEDDIHEALEHKPNSNVAKNVIIFIGDGMDLTTVTASRIYKYGEDKLFPFEKFHNIGLLKTYSANKLVPDSSSTATALFTGLKINHKMTGVDPLISLNDCPGSLQEEMRVDSIADWAQAAGKSTGFVTTTRVTHATPSGLYTHTANRNWECEAKMPVNATRCKDIAKQLVEDVPGKNFNVIFGGGRQCLVSDVKGDLKDPVDKWACISKDGRNLIHDWERDKEHRGTTHAFVENRKQLKALDVLTNQYILGIFANSHMYLRDDNGTLNVVHPRGEGPEEQPSLQEMTEVAIRALQTNKNGYLLMVEGGLIDYAHHRGHARSALEETVEFGKAIESALGLTKDEADETLILVTSDHAHTVVFAGYADRDQGVLGVAQASKWGSKTPYTSLLYGTGGPNNFQFDVVDGQATRVDPSTTDTTSYEYSQQTGMVTDETTHGGADVAVYAKGPMAHLFNSVHEQTYVAYVVAYAARIGPYKDKHMSNYGLNTISTQYIFITVLAAILTTIVLF
ncbi:Alkaline phosphatase 12 [Carabus blaptoides fortunei]